MTWHGSETLPSFNSSDPFEPDPVDTGVGKGTDRSLGDSPSIAQNRISSIQKLRSNMKHTLSALALLSIATTPLFAKEDVVPAIPELPVTIVTGELWESELQETAASVTVIDDKLLQSSGTQHFGNLINAIPNMTWSATSSRPRYIQIRGIGENSQFEGETPDSSVRFMVDDLDFTGLGTIGNLFDRHAALEIGGVLLPFAECHLLAGQQSLDKGIILRLVHGAVDIVLAVAAIRGFVIA